jgi:hypothetical protein
VQGKGAQEQRPCFLPDKDAKEQRRQILPGKGASDSTAKSYDSLKSPEWATAPARVEIPRELRVLPAETRLILGTWTRRKKSRNGREIQVIL